MKINSNTLKKTGTGVIALLAWAILGWLLVSAVHYQKELKLTGMEIQIDNKFNQMHLVNKEMIQEFISGKLSDSIHHFAISEFPVRKISEAVVNHPYIGEAVVFIGKSGLLRVKCTPRYPVARVMPSRGESYYIDSKGVMMPLSDEALLKLPVIRGRVPSLNSENEDDLKRLNELGGLSQSIANSGFLNVLTDQILVTALGEYVLIPTLGSERIELGDLVNVEQKLGDVEAFYEQVIAQVGWNVYENISLKYEGQIVARRADPSSP